MSGEGPQPPGPARVIELWQEPGRRWRWRYLEPSVDGRRPPSRWPLGVPRRGVEQHQAGTNRPEKIRGLYKLAGGGAGFMLIDTDQPRQLMEIL